MMDVKLTPIEERHLMQTQVWINETTINTMLDLSFEKIDESACREWFRKLGSSDDRIVFAICYQDVHVGNCGFYDYDQRRRKAKLWLYVGDDEMRGKGVGKQVMIKLLDYGFKKMDLNKVYLYCLEENHAAKHLYEKLGFVQEGFLREDTFVDGEFKNCLYYGMLRSEYK